jgi:hypothetical protein
VRQIIVEEDMKHPLIGRPVLDKMGFVASVLPPGPMWSYE